MLEFRLLGQFDVRVSGQPLAIPSRLAQSLLAYLLVTRTIHRREKLAGLFWPDTSETNARRSLRHELWHLRKALDVSSPPHSDLLLSDDLSLGIDPQSTYLLDVAILEGACSCSTCDDLACSLDVYRGDLLPDFYDEWIGLDRERLHALFEQQVGRLLDCLRAEQRWSEILTWAERWIALGRSPEPAYRALMVAQSALGNRAQVAAVFERCLTALKKGLEVEPSEQTRSLYEQLSKAEGGRQYAVGGNQEPEGGRQKAAARGRVSAYRLPPTAYRLHPSSFSDAPPYKGLQYFDEADAVLFFGRERLVATLTSHLAEHHWLTVVGASGSGKSSVVRAGLIPALKSAEPLSKGTPLAEENRGWVIHVFTPTAHPLEALAIRLTQGTESAMATTTLMDDLARDTRSLRVYCQKAAGPANRLLLVIDQFEELFTLCHDEAERRAFIDNLLFATAPELDQPLSVMVALRADFYAHCAQYANLREALSRRQEYIGPMTTEEMRRAIEGPAERGGWELEPGLADLILRDVGEEPGALPLLSHALLETWKHRHGRSLTFEGYSSCGGVRGAIAQTAETTFSELAPEGKEIARHIFLQLTELGEGTQDTRRRVVFEDLVSPTANATEVRAVLNRLAEARLVTLEENTVEVTHEALIREWPALREWLNQNREGLRLHRRLTEVSQAWLKSNRDEGELYRGARLAQALEWSKVRTRELTSIEQEFLAASRARQEREEAEREAQRQRELEAARRLLEVERRRTEAETQRAQEHAGANRQLRRRALYLAGALLVAAVLAITAIMFAQRAEDERLVALVRELSVSAVSNLDTDPERSILLALQAVSTSTAGGKPVLREAEEALHRAVLSSRVLLTLRGHTAPLYGLAYSSDGRRLATASLDGTAKVWDATTGQMLLTLTGHAGPVSGVAFSPDATRVATASEDQTAKVWDAITGQLLLTLQGHTDQVRKVAYSLDGKRLVTASGRMATTPSADHTAKVWDATTGQLLLTFTGHSGSIRGISFSPDGTRVATTSDDMTTLVWDATTGQVLLTLHGHTEVVYDAAFSSDGKRLATTSRDRTIKVWDISTPLNTGPASDRLLLTLFGHTSGVWAAAFDQGGTRLYTASLDGTAKVWDSATGQVLLTLVGHASGIRDLVLSPDGARVATASDDNTAKVWDVTPAGGREWLTLTGHSPAAIIYGAVFSPDGTRIATSSADNTAKVWDSVTGKLLLTFAGHADQLRSLEFSPDGRRLVTTSWDQTAKVWNAATGQVLLTLDTRATPSVYELGVKFSPDGRRIATASGNNSAKIWDAYTGQELMTLSGHTGLVVGIAFSPDGTRVATTGAEPDRTAKVWDAATGKELLTLKGHTGGVYTVAFSPDGRRLATGSQDGMAKIWEAATGNELFNLAGHSGQVNAVAFSRDGKHLATGSNDGTVRVWDLAPEFGPSQQPLTLYNPDGSVWSLGFSPDGRRLVTGGFGGVVRVWALPLEDIISIAKSRVTRTLTTDECQKFLHVDKCPPDPRVASALPLAAP